MAHQNWARETATTEIEKLIGEAPNDMSLAHAELWQGELMVCLERNSVLCPIAKVAEALRSIGDQIGSQKLAIQHDWGTGDPNFLNPPILTRCLDFARLARDLIANCPGDSHTNLQNLEAAAPPARPRPAPSQGKVNSQNKQPEQPAAAAGISKFEGDLASRMRAARKAIHHTQEEAAGMMGLNVSTWKRVASRSHSPEDHTISLIEQYISSVEAIIELKAKGVIDSSDPQRINELFRDPAALASLRSLS